MDDDDDNNDDEQQQEEEQEQEPQLLQLIDIEEWFNIHGLRAAVAGNNEGDDDEHDHEHEEHGDQREIRHQVNLEREYQNFPPLVLIVFYLHCFVALRDTYTQGRRSIHDENKNNKNNNTNTTTTNRPSTLFFIVRNDFPMNHRCCWCWRCFPIINRSFLLWCECGNTFRFPKDSP